MKKKDKIRLFWAITGSMVIVSMVLFSFAIGFSF